MKKSKSRGGNSPLGWSEVLHRIPGCWVGESQCEGCLNATEAALLQKLRDDCWPWIGVRCVTFTLAHGRGEYTPAIVTCDEGIAVAWEAVADECSASCPMILHAEALPDDRRLMHIAVFNIFVVACHQWRQSLAYG